MVANSATVTNSVRRSVRAVLTSESITFDNASKPFTLGPAGYFNLFTDFKLADVKDLTNFKIALDFTKFAQDAMGGNARLGEMAGLWLVNLASRNLFKG